MRLLAPPRPPLVTAAIRQARIWCAGHEIDDAPAFAHAARVAATLDHHVPDLDPRWLCAALLHDSPEFVPAGTGLDAALAVYGGDVPRIVRALQAEHQALDKPDPPIDVTDQAVLSVSTADKIVAISSLLRRAAVSGDEPGFWAARPLLRGLTGWFSRYQQAGAGRVPQPMTTRLAALLNQLDHTIHSGQPRVDGTPR